MGIIIDSDAHFLPKDAFDDDENFRRFRSRWPRILTDAIGRTHVVFPERAASLSPHQRLLPGALSPSSDPNTISDGAARVAWLDKGRFDMQVLVPAPSPFTYDLEPEIGLAVCRSYNNAIGRTLKKYPGRFIGLAILPFQDPVAAVEELERAIVDLGIHAPLMVSNVRGRNLDAYEFWPFFERVEKLGVPLIVHGSRFDKGGVLGMDRLDRMHLDNALGFLYEGTLAITSLIMGGVLDMYPRLKVGVLETGGGYLPYLMDRLQEVYDQEVYGGISPSVGIPVKNLIRKPPEEYMNQFWVCFNVEAERRTIPHVVERFGADRFMINSDFPHGFGGGGESALKISDRMTGLTQAQKDQLLGLSACALFGIDPISRKQTRNGGSGRH